MRKLFSFIIILVCINTAAIGGQFQKNRLFPECSPPAEVIDVVDMMSASENTKLAATTLQGQINSGQNSRIYFLLSEHANDSFWLGWLKQKGYIKKTNNLTIEEYFQKYSDSYKKVFVYDPNLPATINIATMLAGLEKGIVIAPADINKYGAGKDIENLKGRWKNNVDAYEWAFTNLWPRMNHGILACFHPTIFSHNLRDYLVRNHVFHFWVTGKNAEDGLKSNHSLEKQFAEKLYKASPANIPIIGWWSGGNDEGQMEYYGVGLAGEYGKLCFCCGQTNNLSLLSGIPVDIAKMVSQYKKRPISPPPVLDNNKVYISFVVIDGDSPDCWQGIQYKGWQDSGRGKIPIGWGITSPTELMPPVMQWYYENATPNDFFFLPPSGACYVHPYRDFLSKTPDPNAAWDGYLSLTQYYMDLLDMHEISLFTDAWLEFNRKDKDPTTLRFVNGLKKVDTLIMGFGRDKGITKYNYLMGQNNVLVSHVITQWDPNNVGRNRKNNLWLAEEIRKHTPKTRPAFVYANPMFWSYWASDIVEVFNELGNEYIAVSPSDLKALYLQAQK